MRFCYCCGARLTDEEAHYYETSCEECERDAYAWCPPEDEPEEASDTRH